MWFAMRDEVIKRVHRQHNSLAMVVPIAVRRLLGIKAGDYVYYSWVRGRKTVTFGKVDLRRRQAREGRKHSVGKNTGG